MKDYKYIVVEVFKSCGETGRHKIRVKPFPGQKYGVDKRIECASSLRKQSNIGKLFLMPVTLKDSLYEKPPLYCHPKWTLKQLTLEEAQDYINKLK